MHRRLAALAAGTILIVAACGDGDGSSVTAPSSTSSPAAADPPAEVVEPLPDVSVQDVGAGTQVNLASLLPADRPILLWMWAPH